MCTSWRKKSLVAFLSLRSLCFRRIFRYESERCCLSVDSLDGYWKPLAVCREPMKQLLEVFFIESTSGGTGAWAGGVTRFLESGQPAVPVRGWASQVCKATRLVVFPRNPRTMETTGRATMRHGRVCRTINSVWKYLMPFYPLCEREAEVVPAIG